MTEIALTTPSLFNAQEMMDIAAAALERGIQPVELVRTAVLNDLFR